jgi:tetratricopeptide (TPR) repeat protein
MGGVFINYRGEDSQTCGALIHRELSLRFGDDKVFLDCSSIPAGADFAEILLGRLRSCSVLLVVIGPRWLTATDQAGRRRIDSPEDWVHREIVEAFRCGLRVIPVLTDDVVIPKESELPGDMAQLGRCQYRRLHHRNTMYDLAQLADTLVAIDPELPVAAPQQWSDISVVPRQLPGAPHQFVGRSRELEFLSGLLRSADGTAGTAVISAINGTAGVGKTALAISWANLVRDQFPDGQLYIDLRAYGPDHPVSASEALAQFLRALGLDGADIPQELAERAARFRTLVDGRRILMLVDNAGSVEQVRPLLPGTSACFVVVTTRESLAGLVAREGAKRLELDRLSMEEAVALLGALIGERVVAEPEAAQALAGCCAQLPLALRVAAEYVVSRPTLSVSDLIAELTTEHGLDLLDADGDPYTGVRAVFSWSYDHLSVEARRLFRLWSIHPGKDLDTHASAALAGVSPAVGRSLVDTLLRAHLIEEASVNRFAMHDLLSVYAGELAHQCDTESEHSQAFRRIFEYYLYSACQAMNIIAPDEKYRRPDERASSLVARSFKNYDQAMEWLESERLNLIALTQRCADFDWPTENGQLTATLYRYLEFRAYHDDAVSLYRQAHDVAFRIDNRANQARAETDLGLVCERVGRYAEALDHLGRAIEVARELGDRTNHGRALNGRGAVYRQLGRYEEAFSHHHEALALSRKHEDRIAEAHALANVGELYQQLNDFDQALEYYGQALNFFREGGNRTRQGRMLNNTGNVYQKLGRYEEAVSHHQQALDLARDYGNRRLETVALNSLGRTAELTGASAEALDYHRRALVIAKQVTDRRDQARAYDGLGRAHHSLGDHAEARLCWQQALTLFTDLGLPDADLVRRHLSTIT